jgi:hypothetical protein
MSVPAYDFDELKELWLTGIEIALAAFAPQLAADDEIYAIAFWLFYAETGAVIRAPLVGIGREISAKQLFGDEDRYAGFGWGRWNPADWHSILDLPNEDEITSAYHRLGTYACGGIDPEEARRLPDGEVQEDLWNFAFDRSIDTIIATCRDLTKRARQKSGVFAHLRLNPEFVAVACDPSQGDDGEKWLSRCVDEPLRSRLFPNLSTS